MPKTSKRAIQAPPTDSLDYGRKRSQWRDVLHRLTRNKLAMLGLVIVLVLVLASFPNTAMSMLAVIFIRFSSSFF